ncbi:hypothetical protein [uncultured Umboniibacter sp.]|uniref:hypothetical protein n=1 Tax=uncultured Umboniibacter sp. TaxID=1798917 RepID=UPI002612B7A3|nr:hypothetical protein [uncultured Umboniibacter sp.]
MTQLYFVSQNDDSILWANRKLRALGFDDNQIELYRTPNNPQASLNSFLHSYWFRYGFAGLAVGLILSALLYAILPSAFLATVGWGFFIPIAVLIIGLATWEGSFIGVQKSFQTVQRLSSALTKGYEVVGVDIEERDIAAVISAMDDRNDIKLL